MELKKITPFLWLNSPADEAAKYYCSIFKNSKIINASPMSATFELEGHRFMVGNFGPMYQFTEATSFYVNCENQDEVDYFWNKLTADGGKEGRCGWLKDKYGLSWQIIPSIFSRLISDPDPAKSQRVMAAMMKMNKMNIKQLQQAYDGE